MSKIKTTISPRRAKKIKNTIKKHLDIKSPTHDIEDYYTVRNLSEHPLTVSNVLTVETPVTNDIRFVIGDKDILKLCENGDIYVNGNLAENDKEVVEALRIFIQGQYII